MLVVTNLNTTVYINTICIFYNRFIVYFSKPHHWYPSESLILLNETINCVVPTPVLKNTLALVSEHTFNAIANWTESNFKVRLFKDDLIV